MLPFYAKLPELIAICPPIDVLVDGTRQYCAASGLVDVGDAEIKNFFASNVVPFLDQDAPEFDKIEFASGSLKKIKAWLDE